jgi:hypothetical protein
VFAFAGDSTITNDFFAGIYLFTDAAENPAASRLF